MKPTISLSVLALCRTTLLAAAGMVVIAGCAADSESSASDDGTSDQEIIACSHGSTVRGIDVSYYQGHIDWPAVHRSGVQFAIARVSDGHFIDPQFQTNWHDMRSAGLIRGAYQFFRPNEDPVAQADILINRVGHLGPDDLPATIDVEVTGGVSPRVIADRVATWMARVEAGTGKRPLIYTGAWFWDPDVDSTRFARDDLWVSGYVSCPNTPVGWRHWTMWQYTDHVHVPGISAGGVDGDIFEGSLDQLRAFANGGTGTPVPPRPDTLPAQRVGRNADGRLEIFARGSDNAVWHNWQERVGGAWAGWHSLEGIVHGDPVVANNQDGKLEVFAIGGGGALYRRHEENAWGTGWDHLGGANFTFEPAVVRDRAGLLHVFVRNTSAQIMELVQTAPNGGFGAWHHIANDADAEPVAAVDSDGHLEVFYRAVSNDLTRLSNASGSWVAHGMGGNLTSSPAVGTNEDGRLEVFARGTDNKLWHLWQRAAGGWTGWDALGNETVASGPSVASNHDGRLEVVARTTGDAIWHIWQTTPNGGWSNGARYATGHEMRAAPAIILNGSNGLEVFARGTDGTLYHVWQGSSGWTDWHSLGDGAAYF